MDESSSNRRYTFLQDDSVGLSRMLRLVFKSVSGRNYMQLSKNMMNIVPRSEFAFLKTSGGAISVPFGGLNLVMKRFIKRGRVGLMSLQIS